MRGLFFPYLALRIKKAAHYLPYALLIGLLLFAAVGAYAVFAASAHDSDAMNSKTEIGIVGGENDPYVQTVIFIINNLDDMQISMHLTRMEEETAYSRLKAGELHSFLIIPDDFEEALLRGEISPVVYVSSPDSAGITYVVTDEIARALSSVLVCGENATFGIRNYVRDKMPGESAYPYALKITEDHYARIADRASLFRIEELGVNGSGRDFFASMAIALIVFFLLIWGVACAPLFSRRPESNRLLAASGLSGAGQIGAEYLAFLLLTFLFLGVILLPAGIALYRFFPAFFASLFPEEEGFFVFLLRLALSAAVLGAMHFLFYESARDTIPALILQTLTALGLGYISGCFYSSYFFPPVVQKITSFLPAGAAIRFLSGEGPLYGTILLGHAVLFFVLSCVFRRAETEGDAI